EATDLSLAEALQAAGIGEQPNNGNAVLERLKAGRV
ncbi:MAG: hypothetical protein ACJATP_003190, partial [Candidatus Azotimanducaceae bacterium]